MGSTTNNEFRIERWMQGNIFTRLLTILLMIVLLVLLVIFIIPLWVAKEIIDFCESRKGKQHAQNDSYL